MSSQLQIDANRRNAQLSTGPRSPEGKAKVANNGRTHGLCSRNPLLPMEDAAEFQALLDRLRAVYQPADEAQESSLRELAWAEWRLRRVVRIESGLFAYRVEKMRLIENCKFAARKPACSRRKAVYDENTRLLGVAFFRDCEDNAFVKLNRYENSLRRAYYKALKELQAPKPPRKDDPTEQTQLPPSDNTPRDPTPPPPSPTGGRHQELTNQTQIPPPDPPQCTPPPEAANRRSRSTQEMPVDTRRAPAGEPRRTQMYVEGAGQAQRSRHGHIVRRHARPHAPSQGCTVDI